MMGDAFAFIGQRLARILVGRQLLRDSNHAAMLHVSKVQMRELFLERRDGEKKIDFEFVQKLSSNVFIILDRLSGGGGGRVSANFCR